MEHHQNLSFQGFQVWWRGIPTLPRLRRDGAATRHRSPLIGVYGYWHSAGFAPAFPSDRLVGGPAPRPTRSTKPINERHSTIVSIRKRRQRRRRSAASTGSAILVSIDEAAKEGAHGRFFSAGIRSGASGSARQSCNVWPSGKTYRCTKISPLRGVRATGEPRARCRSRPHSLPPRRVQGWKLVHVFRIRRSRRTASDAGGRRRLVRRRRPRQHGGVPWDGRLAGDADGAGKPTAPPPNFDWDAELGA